MCIYVQSEERYVQHAFMLSRTKSVSQYFKMIIFLQ